MFADPQAVTYATVAKSLPRIGGDDQHSAYRLNDSGVVYNFDLSHQNKARNRVVARLQRTSNVADPLIPSQNIPASMTATFTIDFPNIGLSTTDAQNLGNTLVAWLTSANILKLANGET
ncbi:TPA_asm: coat protein [ssRNA phage Zoerhiza.1_31]|jgi:hypothetical protein|uniref:Coat protein n=2 Tax=Leviviricetes TaxID=2842243 RepID=A0A8S5L2E5_9VIRU|nr:coat protein [ssRNA phage Zoerhiza.1_31]QDH88515.1 MAG: hypothetical protein H1Rhizo26FD619_000002 [Leviviridae sp.]DAD51667.1 TPA_asm: coat protein [ssRNA phage Zoerhiza.1_31]